MHRIYSSLALVAGVALAAPMAAKAETKPAKPFIDVISFQTAKPDASKGKGAPTIQASTQAGGGGGSGKVVMQDIHISKAKAGETKPPLTVRKAGGHPQE